MKTIQKVLVLFIVSLFTFSLNAQEKLKGNKEVTTENRNLTDFTKIEVIDNVAVELLYNESQSVEVTTDSNLQETVITEVKNGILSIKLNDKILRKKELVVTIKVNKTIEEINAYNKAIIKSDNTLIIDNLTLTAFDNATFNLKLNSKTVNINSKKTSDLKLEILAESLTVNSEESSQLKLNCNTKTSYINALDKSQISADGTTDYLEIEAFGNTTYKGKTMEVKEALVKTNNTTDVYINATETLTIYARNSSEIYIYSNPKIALTEFFDKAAIYKKEL